MSNVTEISIFAERHQVGPEAYVLPTIFSKIAEMMELPERAIISQATYTNQPLADYIKERALFVAKQMEDSAK